MTLRLVGAVLAGAALAGCAQLPAPLAELPQRVQRLAGPKVAMPRPVPVRVPRLAPRGLPAPTAVPGPQGRGALYRWGAHPAQVALPSHIDGPLPVPAYRPPRPGEALGLQPGALLALLGEPRLRWQEGPAEVWQYDGHVCVLDAYLEPRAGRAEVVHLEARRANGHDARTGRCLTALLAARGAALAPGEKPVQAAHQNE